MTGNVRGVAAAAALSIVILTGSGSDVQAASAFCSGAPYVWAIPITGPGIRLGSAGVNDLEAGETLTFSTVNSPDTPTRWRVDIPPFGFSGSNFSQRIIDVSTPDNTRTSVSFTAQNTGSGSISYGASANAVGAPALVEITVTCTPATTGGGTGGGTGGSTGGSTGGGTGGSTGGGTGGSTGGGTGGGTGSGIDLATIKGNLAKSAYDSFYGQGASEFSGGIKAGAMLGVDTSQAEKEYAEAFRRQKALDELAEIQAEIARL